MRFKLRLGRGYSSQVKLGVIIVTGVSIVLFRTVFCELQTSNSIPSASILAEQSKDEKLIRVVFDHAADACNTANWEQFVSLMSSDMKRFWVLAWISQGTSANLEQVKNTNLLISQDRELSESLDNFLDNITKDGDEREEDARFAKTHPDDIVAKYYGVSNARISHRFLEFEFLDRLLLQILHHFEILPRLRFGDMISVEIRGPHAILQVRALAKNRMFGSHGPSGIVVEPIQVFLKYESDEWKITSFPGF